MKLSAILASLFLLFAAISIPDYSDAARMGGGRSFGSRPSMSQPAQRPMQRQTTPGAAAQAPGKTGMFGGMAGGLLGGLLAGTLLGSLFSGNGMGGGGGFMDLILIAILAFIGWKLYQRFRANRAAQSAGGGGLFNNPMQRSAPQEADWRPASSPAAGPIPAAIDPAVDVPAGFDANEFLRGAKMAYTRMQQSWDKRDLNDISQFATPTVMRELQAQAAQDPAPSRTEIMMVNAELVGMEPEGDNLRAQVYFDVLMREDPSQPAPENVREIWHFLRIGKNGNWKLDGIQQVN